MPYLSAARVYGSYGLYGLSVLHSFSVCCYPRRVVTCSPSLGWDGGIGSEKKKHCSPSAFTRSSGETANLSAAAPQTRTDEHKPPHTDWAWALDFLSDITDLSAEEACCILCLQLFGVADSKVRSSPEHSIIKGMLHWCKTAMISHCYPQHTIHIAWSKNN